MIDEGYIKFDCIWDQVPIDPSIVPNALTEVRDALHGYGLVGVYSDSGIGFGNVSLRLQDGRILISGSATGSFFPSLPVHFSIVERVELEFNRVWCKGMYPASSETMTHAILYKLDPNIGSVLHVHSKEMWGRLLGQIPTTRSGIGYGTVEMAKEVERLFLEDGLASAGIFAMAGHEEGLVAFGESPEVAMRKILAKR